MRHVALTTIAAFTAVVAIVACEEQSPDRSLTAPDVSYAKGGGGGGGACDGTLERTITRQISDLFDRPELDSANSLWGVVSNNCASDSVVAREAMLTYVQFTIDMFKAEQIVAPDTGTVEGALLAHWNLTFPYVGYTAPGLPVSVLGPLGAAGVITQTTVDRELRAAEAAITVPHQLVTGDQRGHLFTINPTSPIDCLGDINLDQYGPCYNFHSFPTVNPLFDSAVKVGVCQPIDENDVLPLERAALGHRPSNSSAFVEIPPQTSYPTFCSHLDEIVDAGSWNGGIKGIAKKLVYLANRTFGVKPVYAVHGGLGGLGTGISPFGGVDRTVLFAPQHDEVLGQFPALPEIGTWTSDVKAPGSITTAASLGQLNDTVIVLAQAGGNCTRCKGLLLQANLADSTTAQTGATYGRYEVGWTSVQASSNIKNAPFVIRQANNQNIATLAYSTESSVNRLRYNGIDVGPWVQNVPQTFVIEVNLNNPRSTKLFIDNVQITTGALPNGTYPFQNNVTSMKQLAAAFSGIDSGTMGWAKLFVRRLTD